MSWFVAIDDWPSHYFLHSKKTFAVEIKSIPASLHVGAHERDMQSLNELPVL